MQIQNPSAVGNPDETPIIMPDSPEEADAMFNAVNQNRINLGLPPQCKHCYEPVDAHAADCRKTKPKIYAFINGGDGIGGVMVVALAEDGEYLAGHASSNEGWAMRDIDHKAKHERYLAKYPDGYDFIWLSPDTDPEAKAIVDELAAKNQAQAAAAPEESAIGGQE